MAEERFLIKDPVHGSIELCGGYLRHIIDSREFQRLRNIKQLGGASYVYPGATHTRFEHSIGVCYIAGELLKSLQERDEKFKHFVSNSDIKCVKIAALCHDLGHGPFSHLYDFSITEEDKKDNDLAHHEYRSVKIFERICENFEKKNHGNEIATYGEKKFVGKLITFCEDYEKGKKKWSDQNNGKEIEPSTSEKDILKVIPNDPDDSYYLDLLDKMFLFEIVANGFTGIDVDKMDYFLRDGHLTGLDIMFDWRRYIQTLRVLRNEEGINHLCSRDKEERELYQLFHVRNQLHHQMCRHKTTVAVEYMLGEALKKADKALSIRNPAAQTEDRSILKAWEDIDSFLLLDDTVEQVIMLTQPQQSQNKDDSKDDAYVNFIYHGPPCADELLTAKTILRNIRKRKLCKYIGEIPLCDEKTDQDQLADDETFISKFQNDKDIELFSKKAKFSYGKEDQNPIEYHYFYKKTNNPKPFRKEKLSQMLPNEFMEKKLMYYIRKKDWKKELEPEEIDFMKRKFESAITKKAPSQEPTVDPAWNSTPMQIEEGVNGQVP